jgi:cell division protein FtsB
MKFKPYLIYQLIFVLSISIFILVPNTGPFAATAATSNQAEIERLEKEIQAKEAKIKELEAEAAAYKKNIEEK